MSSDQRTSTIAVDFDGVVHYYREGWRDGSIYDVPVPGALKALDMLRETHAVVIHTTRSPEQVAAWLRDRRVPAVAESELGSVGPLVFWDDRERILVTSRKLPAVAYIDDRGVRFTTWSDTLWTLDHLGIRPHPLSREVEGT